MNSLAELVSEVHITLFRANRCTQLYCVCGMEVYHSSYYHHTHLCRYLLNPLTILSTSSFSTVNLTNLFIILSLTMIAKGDVYLVLELL